MSIFFSKSIFVFLIRKINFLIRKKSFLNRKIIVKEAFTTTCIVFIRFWGNFSFVGCWRGFV